VNRLAMRAALAVAAVYGHFLIFAQLSFVELLRGTGIAPEMEKALLGAMAVAGVAGGFLTSWHRSRVPSPSCHRRMSLIRCSA